jgi:hypothetical protein
MTVPNLAPPESKIGALRAILLALLEKHERDGALPTSARFLYYELVQRGQLSKERTGARRPDQDLHDALTNIREDGRWIVDETRSLDDYTGYSTIKDGVLAKLPYIKLDSVARSCADDLDRSPLSRGRATAHRQPLPLPHRRH